MKDRPLFSIALAASVLLTPAPGALGDSKAEQELKKKVAEREAKTPPGIRLATPSELEKLYLDGHITAREYKRKLADYKASVASLTNKNTEAQAIEALRQDASKAVPPATTESKPRTPTPPVAARPNESSPEDKKLTDVEAKFDELIQKKAEREKAAKAAQTNAPPAIAKTRREKLDALLKAYIDGKLSEKDYEAQRAKVISDPE